MTPAVSMPCRASSRASWSTNACTAPV
jgi:hypothetical protein